MNKNIIIGIGELLWDMLPSGKRAGGAPVNFVYHAIQAGADGYAVSAVGKDELGTEILEQLQQNHIKFVSQKNNHPTGTVEVELENGIPTYKIVENVAWDFIENSAQLKELIQSSNVLCFGTLALRNTVSRKTILDLIDAAPQQTLKVFDINLREHFYSRDLILKLLNKTDILKINDIEMVILRQLFELKGSDEEICDYILHKYNLKYLIFTGGDKFSSIYSLNDYTLLETPKVDVADTIGAGDAFTATFVQSILSGKGQLEAHKRAVAVAAFVCTKSGAWPKYDHKKIEEIENGI